MPAELPKLLFLSDSFVQPGLSLFKQLLSEADDQACLLCAQQDYRDLLPEESNIKVLDGLRSEKAQANVQSILSLPLEQLYTLISSIHPSVLLVDSLNALELLFSAQDLYKLFKKLMHNTRLRLVLLHHSDMASIPSHRPFEDLAMLFCQPAFSPTILHLVLYPVGLLNLLHSTFTTSSQDAKIHEYLSRFHKRGWGGFGYRRDASDEHEQQTSLDGLGNAHIGQCILSWELQGLAESSALQVLGSKLRLGNVNKRIDKSEQVSTVRTGVKISRGMSGLQTQRDGKIEVIGLSSVNGLNENKAAKSSSNSTAKDPDVTSTLPFNLSLTENQRSAKDNVVLPYLPKAFDGQNQKKPAIAGGKVFYEPDKEDDVDYEEPEDDFEL